MRLWNMFYFFAMGVSMPYFPVVLDRSGLTPSQIGLAFTISNIAAGLFSYYVGRLSDNIGRVRMMIYMTLFTSLTYSLLFIDLGPIITVAVFTLLMMSGGAALTTITAYTVDVLEQIGLSRGGGFGRIRIGGGIGWVPGTFLGGFMVSALGLRSVFLVSSLVVGLSALTCWGLSEGRSARRGDRVRVSSLSLLRGSAGALLVMSTLAFMVLASVMSFLSLHMINTLNASPLQVSAAFALMGLSEIPAMIYLGRLSDRVGRRPILLLCLAAFPVRQAIIALAGDANLVILAQVLNAFTYGGMYVVSIALVSEIVPENVRGAYLGLHGASFNLAGVIGGYLWGSIAEATSYATMFLYTAIFSFAPLAIAALAIKKPRHEVCLAPAAP